MPSGRVGSVVVVATVVDDVVVVDVVVVVEMGGAVLVVEAEIVVGVVATGTASWDVTSSEPEQPAPATSTAPTASPSARRTVTARASHRGGADRAAPGACADAARAQ